MTRILVTGATGFVGRALTSLLLSQGVEVRGTLLPGESPDALVKGVTPAPVEPVGPDTVWGEALHGVDAVVHLAARVHVLRETACDPLAEFRRTNTEGSIRLAREAAANGVRRFIFMSTIGVNGDDSGEGAFTEESLARPHNNYSHSKMDAEQGLWGVAAETGLQLAILRAPLVYGPGNPGNFLTLLKAVKKGIPLPLASVANSRSFIYVGNLAHALSVVVVHPQAGGKLYVVSDGDDISTPALIERLAKAMERPVRLVPLPPALLRLAGAAVGRGATMRSLLASLSVDSGKIRRELGWQPPFGAADALSRTALWYKDLDR